MGKLIADTYDKGCVDRAISTMRAALGYNTALPEGWNPKSRNTADVIRLAGMSFPGREVKVWCTEENWNKIERAENMIYEGAHLTPGKWCNSYLFGFVYGPPDGDIGHMVVGWPIAYGDMQMSLTIGVKIEA